MEGQLVEIWDDQVAPPATERLLPFGFRWRPSDLSMFAALGVPKAGEWLLVHAYIQKPRQTSTYDYLLLTSDRLLMLSFVWPKLRYKLMEFPRASLRLGLARHGRQDWILALGPGKGVTFRAYSAGREIRRTSVLTVLGKFIGL
jgi:hypothetical protein